MSLEGEHERGGFGRLGLGRGSKAGRGDDDKGEEAEEQLHASWIDSGSRALSS